jgi:hypothetical protein
VGWRQLRVESPPSTWPRSRWDHVAFNPARIVAAVREARFGERHWPDRLAGR